MSSYGYCERTDPSFWAEPLNAWSNGAFLLAALAGLMLLRRAGRADWPAAILTALVLAIAIGSFLFHTMPQRWTLLADVVPIQLFAFFYFGLALRRFFGASAAGAILGTLFFLAASSALAALLGLWLPPVLRGSTGYAGFVIALFGVAAGLALRGQASAIACQIGLAGLVFALSLTLRSLDGVLCQRLPLGLHWAWHLLNAAVLYLLLRAAITHRRPSGGV
ncbi:MAG TPA: ceramidase domain-containing protein [Bosea sp. (in: a-proteobacteria)]|jgi:hypothetical protein|uniref:ceramidase domain-containing protein n=1 Tax=Bosea sp. (in: a-proteobacteria) TaxID=1871050 RepID=UPI002E143599|nr:ceramidase domain-containing protein [Bosea sp. (in: a-proteobacteria)]